MAIGAGVGVSIAGSQLVTLVSVVARWKARDCNDSMCIKWVGGCPESNWAIAEQDGAVAAYVDACILCSYELWRSCKPRKLTLLKNNIVWPTSRMNRL